MEEFQKVSVVFWDKTSQRELKKQGLMTDDHRLFVIQASGSIYTNKDRYQSLDISQLYLQSIFKEIMGFSHVDMLRIEGTAVLDKNEIIETGIFELKKKLDYFYS